MDKFSFTEKINKMQREQLVLVEDTTKDVKVEPGYNKSDERTGEVDEHATEEKTTKAAKRNYTSISSSTDFNVEEDSTGHSTHSDDTGKDKIQNFQQVTEETQGKKSKWEPPDWFTVLNYIREMRKNMDAPVDSMGYHKCHDDAAPPEIKRYQALIALMLSNQTRDKVTFEAMQKLREHGLTVDSILATDTDTLAKLIGRVSFWKTKTINMKKTTEILKEKYNGDIPNTVEKLCELPGIGPKMAHLCMQTAWGIPSGIGVDTHVHRIVNRLGWVKNTQTHEETRKELESWLPPDLWNEVSHLLVGFGQLNCLPSRPKCETCLCNKLCPTAKEFIKPPSKRALKRKHLKLAFEHGSNKSDLSDSDEKKLIDTFPTSTEQPKGDGDGKTELKPEITQDNVQQVNRISDSMGYVPYK